MKALILGGGIVGLWTADVLVRRGHDVTVISKTRFESTTSAAAVCVLTPFFPWDPSTEVFAKGVRWAAETLAHMKSLDSDGRLLERVPCYEFGRDGMLEAEFPVSKLDYLDFSAFEIVKLDRLIAGCNFAVAFECHLCNTSVFLPWLHDSLISNGVRFEYRTLETRSDIHATDVDVVFNCLGYHSLFPDPELYPVRGQSMFVPVDFQPAPHFGIGAGHHAVFKHRTGFYLGSYFVQDVSDTLPMEDLYRQSLEFVRGPFVELCESVGIVAPSIDLSRIERVNAGIRPFRKSGPRVEVQVLESVCVVHNYGHGAHGWTIGYASAEEAVRLAELAS